MKDLCIDASVAIKWVIKGERYRRRAVAMLRDAKKRQITLIAPPFFMSEVDSVILKHLYFGRMTKEQAESAFQFLDAIPILIAEPLGLQARARSIALQHKQKSVYDAVYAALAELRQCEFWTGDQPFYNAVKASLSFVRFIADYT